MNAPKNKWAIDYADCKVNETEDPYLHKMLVDAVLHGVEKHADHVYKTEFNPKQDLESYVCGDYPEDML